MHSFVRSVCVGSLAMMLLSLAACDSVVDSSNAAASVTSRVFSDTTSTWIDAFTYHPKRGPQAPQTRYCYRMMTDIVCYDSLQPGLTAKLVGYQDGTHLSWVQPGGGSLGASGGDPVSFKPNTNAPVGENVYQVTNKLHGTPAENPSNNQGVIQTMDLPAPK